jgi:hypothetical protein
MDPVNELTEDEQALLDQIAPNTTLDELGGGPRRGAAPLEEEDDDILGGEEEEDGETPEGFVPKAKFDELSGEIAGLRKLFSERGKPDLEPATPTFAPAPVAAPVPAAPPPMDQAQKDALVAKFFEDPIGFSNMIAQNAVAAERSKNDTRHVETTATIARSEAGRIRDEVARDYPQYKGALPAMDKLIADTPAATLTALMSSGKLRDVYMDNFKAKAFDVAHRVNSAAVARRRPAGEEPPQLGARGLASVSPLDKKGAGDKTIRVSELNEVDREAVVQMRKLKFTDKEILAALKAG